MDFDPYYLKKAAQIFTGLHPIPDSMCNMEKVSKMPNSIV